MKIVTCNHSEGNKLIAVWIHCMYQDYESHLKSSIFKAFIRLPDQEEMTCLDFTEFDNTQRTRLVPNNQDLLTRTFDVTKNYANTFFFGLN